jgi:RNA polymerase sigma factor (sigma-70 family)
MRAPLSPSSDVRTPPVAPPATRGRVLLETHLDLIQRKLRYLSRSGGLPDSEVEEFLSWALLKLIDSDYRILGKWEGRSTFSTYLTVVLVNLMRDYRIHLWGKRPSAASRRQGQEPPARPMRQRVSEEELLQIPVDGQVEIRIEERERACIAGRLRDLLTPLLRSLPAEDRLILKLHFFDGFSMATIAPMVGRPQKELYGLRDRCLKRLRRSLDEGGMGLKQVREVFGHFCFDLKTLLPG